MTSKNGWSVRPGAALAKPHAFCLISTQQMTPMRRYFNQQSAPNVITIDSTQTAAFKQETE
jgi:hypothetical protein